jgi:hypothetical protein
MRCTNNLNALSIIACANVSAGSNCVQATRYHCKHYGYFIFKAIGLYVIHKSRFKEYLNRFLGWPLFCLTGGGLFYIYPVLHIYCLPTSYRA